MVTIMYNKKSSDFGHHLTLLVFQYFPVNPLTPIGDQDRPSPHNIHTMSSRQVIRMKRNIN